MVLVICLAPLHIYIYIYIYIAICTLYIKLCDCVNLCEDVTLCDNVLNLPDDIVTNLPTILEFDIGNNDNSALLEMLLDLYLERKPFLDKVLDYYFPGPKTTL